MTAAYCSTRNSFQIPTRVCLSLKLLNGEMLFSVSHERDMSDNFMRTLQKCNYVMHFQCIKLSKNI